MGLGKNYKNVERKNLWKVKKHKKTSLDGKENFISPEGVREEGNDRIAL